MRPPEEVAVVEEPKEVEEIRSPDIEFDTFSEATLEALAEVPPAPPESIDGLLARAQTVLLQLEEEAEEEADELRDAELPSVPELETLSPSQREHVTGRSLGETRGEEEIEFWTETEESEDEVLGFQDSGESRFIAAHVLSGRREAMVETIRRDIEAVDENLQYLDVKTSMRLHELRQLIARQEKRMRGLRSALGKATTREMNQIMAAGWSRKGELEHHRVIIIMKLLILMSSTNTILRRSYPHPSIVFVPIQIIP